MLLRAAWVLRFAAVLPASRSHGSRLMLRGDFILLFVMKDSAAPGKTKAKASKQMKFKSVNELEEAERSPKTRRQIS